MRNTFIRKTHKTIECNFKNKKEAKKKRDGFFFKWGGGGEGVQIKISKIDEDHLLKTTKPHQLTLLSTKLVQKQKSYKLFKNHYNRRRRRQTTTTDDDDDRHRTRQMKCFFEIRPEIQKSLPKSKNSMFRAKSICLPLERGSHNNHNTTINEPYSDHNNCDLTVAQ